MKASNAASASLLVSAIQISCNARLAFGCWLFGSLLRTLAVLCTQQRCSRVVGHSSPSAFQKPSAPSATASSGATARPRFFKSSKGADAFETGIAVKPRARLVREWGGRVHTVLVLENGFDYAGERYRSLTQIATRITGAHW